MSTLETAAQTLTNEASKSGMSTTKKVVIGLAAVTVTVAACGVALWVKARRDAKRVKELQAELEAAKAAKTVE